MDIYFEDFLKEFLGEQYEEVYENNPLARLDILRDFEIVKRKFRGTKDERSMIKLSYLGEYLNAKKLKALIESHNSNHPQEYHLKLKGAANL